MTNIASRLNRDRLDIMPRVLIIAYGNPMRCDDGIAWRAADALEEHFSSSEVEILRVHQLAPELAEEITRCDAVIFVDAASPDSNNGKPGEVRCQEIGLLQGAPRFSHQLSPAALVALARQLYSARPSAFSVTLAGQCFDHGDSLSPVVEVALPTLVVRIVALVESVLSQSLPPARNKA